MFGTAGARYLSLLCFVYFTVAAWACVRAPSSAVEHCTIFVSTTADDLKSGDKAHPFATLERARDHLRTIKGGYAKPINSTALDSAGVCQIQIKLTLVNAKNTKANSSLCNEVAPCLSFS